MAPLTNPLTGPDPYQNRARILELLKRYKEEWFEGHVVFERQWQKVLNYVFGRQWIWWNPNVRQWVDKTLAKWIPKPVTNITRVSLISIRAMFADVALVGMGRPNGNDPVDVQTASLATDMNPVLHESHEMDRKMNIADFWFITCGNVWLHTYWDKDPKYGMVNVPLLACPSCGLQEINSSTLEEEVCPACGAPGLQPDVDEAGQPKPPLQMPQGAGKTDVYSPFEIGGPSSIPEFEDWPGLMVKRWRDKSYYEDNYPELAKTLKFQKTPSDRGLQIFKSLAAQNDIDPANIHREFSTGNVSYNEGIEEYELWLKPNREWPKGLFARMVGDKGDIVLEDPDQSLPGPLPYQDIKGVPLFPWVHGGFEVYGGRVWASGALDGVIQKNDQINKLDSMGLLCIERMSNPVIVVPKGSEVEKFTGEPGLVWKYNLLGPGGMGEPKRLEGINPPTALVGYREIAQRDAQEQAGTFDIAQGDRPLGVEAFSAIQALIERNQDRFRTAFKQRGRMYRDWYRFALELERQFGPEERVHSILGPNRGWTFQNFKKAQLQGNISIIVEDGSQTPKTSLGIRAAIDQAANLGLLNPSDPDERFAMLGHFGLQQMAPALDQDMKSALQEQDEFEKWVRDGMQTDPPMRTELWHEPLVHYREHRKWANSDRFREMITRIHPQMAEMVRQIVGQHLLEHQSIAIQQAQLSQMGLSGGLAGVSEPQGGGRAMRNSNQESGATDTVPRGNRENTQQMGPV